MKKKTKPLSPTARRVLELGHSRPFRPFAIRLNNGAEHQFREDREFGSTHNGALIVHFYEGSLTSIPAEAIAEVIE